MTNKDIHIAFKTIHTLEQSIAAQHDDKLIRELYHQRIGMINMIVEVLKTNRMEFKEQYEKWSAKR